MTRLKTLKWKDIVKSKLYIDQAGKCADCNGEITSEWQKHVKWKVPVQRGGSITDYNNLKLVHRDCNVMRRKPQAERSTIIQTLFEQGISVDAIARALGISVRTVYRYVSPGRMKAIMAGYLPQVHNFFAIAVPPQVPDLTDFLNLLLTSV